METDGTKSFTSQMRILASNQQPQVTEGHYSAMASITKLAGYARADRMCCIASNIQKYLNKTFLISIAAFCIATFNVQTPGETETRMRSLS